MTFSSNKELSFKQLLDDTDPAVQAGLIREFLENKEAAFNFLKKISDDTDASLAQSANFYLKQLFLADASFAFLYWIHHDEVDLLQAAAVIERIIRPEVNEAMLERTIEAFAERVRDLAPSPGSHKEKIRIINRILFHEGGFRAEADKVYAPTFSLLYSSIQQRRGLSFTLAILYKIIAEHAGLDLGFILFPGNHAFLQFHYSDDDSLFIDPAESGTFHTIDELKTLLGAYPIEIEDCGFTPLTHLKIVKHWCQQLAQQCSGSSDLQQHVTLFEKFVKLLTQKS